MNASRNYFMMRSFNMKKIIINKHICKSLDIEEKMRNQLKVSNKEDISHNITIFSNKTYLII